MVEPIPTAEALDDYLRDLIQAVYGACNTGNAHLQDPDPKIVDQAIADCEEVLNVIMAGKVDEWIN